MHKIIYNSLSCTLWVILLALACNEQKLELTNTGTKVVVVEKTETIDKLPVDILFVIDNSLSMCQEQANLAQNFERLATSIAQLDINYQIAVVTTDMEDPLHQGRLQNTPARSVDKECADESFPETCVTADDCNTTEFLEIFPTRNCIDTGEQHPITNQQIFKCIVPPQTDDCLDIDYPTILNGESIAAMTVADPDMDLAKAFRCIATVGTTGTGFESGLQAAKTAITLAKNDQLLDNPNRGFLRDNAVLTVIFITDENDCSHLDSNQSLFVRGDDCEINSSDLVDVSDFYNSMSAAKTNPSRVLVAGIVGPEPGGGTVTGVAPEPTCETNFGTADDGWRYRQLIDAFEVNGIEEDICTNNFSSALDNIGRLIKNTISSLQLSQLVSHPKAIIVFKVTGEGETRIKTQLTLCETETSSDCDYSVVRTTDENEQPIDVVKLRETAIPIQGESIEIQFLSDIED
jgi:hypothetical protein